MKQGKTIFVGLSGGVDSSVAALRLKQQGHTVVGVFIKVWHPDFMVCNWEQERLDAMRVAAHLEIPFLTCDAEAAYRDEVASYFVSEYLAGRTPNPDVMCNQHVKFGHFLQFAKERGADYIATGHYARRVDGEHIPELHRGIDTNKDQSYFLWTLSKEQLAYTLFPVGDTPKEQIRHEAMRAKIPVAAKRDSQGICFLGHVDIKEFLSHYTTLVTGPVLNTDGETVGTHSGALIYTLGQRHGFSLSIEESKTVPHYVVAKDVTANTITVSKTPPQETSEHKLYLVNTVLREPITTGDTLDIQIRYRQKPITVTVQKHSSTEVTLTVPARTDIAASGQSCVLYQGTLCIGGGIIQ
jgi:tRNA-specific 2-thiouridylase